MNTKLTVPAILFLFAAAAAAAESAPWYLWDSAFDGKTQCAQVSPGKDWTKIDGSFSNSSCSTPQSQFQDRQKKMLKIMSIYFSAKPAK